MPRGARVEGPVHAMTHVEDCPGCEDFADAHRMFGSCALCGLAHERDSLMHVDIVSMRPVCDICWDKCGRDPIETARRVSGKTESLDYDHGRFLNINAA